MYFCSTKKMVKIMEYNPKIIGREHEQDILQHCVESMLRIAVCMVA